MSNAETISISCQGKRSSIKSAFVGSIVFAFVDLATIHINTYLIKHVDTPDSFDGVIFSAIWFVIVFLIGFALAYFPARFLGGLLARLLVGEFNKRKLTKRIASTKGASIGGLSGMLICLPVLLIDYIFIKQSGHGDLLVSLYRLVVATIIASLSGAWSGLQIEKYILCGEPEATCYVDPKF